MNNENKDKEEKLVICENCKIPTDGEVIASVDGDICSKCFNDEYRKCVDCGNIEHSDDSYFAEGNGYICISCYENEYFSCESCDEIIDNNHHCCDGYCESCCSNHNNSSEESIDDLHRDYSRTTRKFMSKNIGDIIHTKRIFSTEIECYYPNWSSAENVACVMPKELGIAEDGSLNSCGVEFITPKLSGKLGEDFIKNLCNELCKNDFHVDKQCGLHIHLDGGRKLIEGKDIKQGKVSPENIKKLFAFYYNFDNVLMSFMPKSRRSNRYCFALKTMYEKEPNILDNVLRCKTLSDFEDIWYRETNKREINRRKANKYDNSRYAGVNFHSLLSNNHIEIRFHSGTIDSTKILNWIELNCRIMDRIIEGKIELSQITNLTNMSISDKTLYFFNLLKLDKKLVQFYIERQKKFISGNEDTDNLCVE